MQTTTHEPARTAFAQRAMTLGDYLGEHFRKTVIAGVGSPGRMVRVVPPEVETTGGGKQAREIVQLVRRDGRVPPVVCGFIDVGTGEAQMRGFDALEAMQIERQGTSLALSRSSYEEFLADLRDALDNHQISMRIINEVTHVKQAATSGPAPASAEAPQPLRRNATALPLPRSAPVTPMVTRSTRPVAPPSIWSQVSQREWLMLAGGILVGVILAALT